MLMELETDEEPNEPSISFGITVIGVACVSIITVAIIVDRRIKLKL